MESARTSVDGLASKGHAVTEVSCAVGEKVVGLTLLSQTALTSAVADSICGTVRVARPSSSSFRRVAENADAATFDAAEIVHAGYQ